MAEGMDTRAEVGLSIVLLLTLGEDVSRRQKDSTGTCVLPLDRLFHAVKPIRPGIEKVVHEG
jgi:hypothetical protein